MPELISQSKSWTNPISFDTYVPLLSDPADITTALKLFFFGNSDSGNNFEEKSIYSHLVNLNTLSNLSLDGITLHESKNSDVHGVGEGNVVGTTTIQEISNKTITASLLSNPKINENISTTTKSTQLNILKGATLSTNELNKLKGATFTTTELNRIVGIKSSIQDQLNSKQNSIDNGLDIIKSYTITTGTSAFLITNIFSSNYDNYKIKIVNAKTLSSGSIFLGWASSGSSKFTKSIVTYAGTASHTFSTSINIGDSSTGGFTSEIDIYNPYLAKPTAIKYTTIQNLTSGSLFRGGGYAPSNTSTTYLSIACSPLTTFTLGTVSVYGYRKG